MAKKKPVPPPAAPDRLWLIRSIQTAAPAAIDVLAYGLGDEHGKLVGMLQEAAGDSKPMTLINEERDLGRIVNWIEQAFAVGVAVGQRLSPGAFDVEGGAR